MSYTIKYGTVSMKDLDVTEVLESEGNDRSKPELDQSDSVTILKHLGDKRGYHTAIINPRGRRKCVLTRELKQASVATRAFVSP